MRISEKVSDMKAEAAAIVALKKRNDK